MPKSQQPKPRLVAVSEIPKSTRKSIYVELVDEFAKGDLQNAKIEGAKLSATVSEDVHHANAQDVLLESIEVEA